MGYSFMSIAKINSKSVMMGKYNHNYRIGEVPNAEKELEYLNDELIKLNGKTYVEAFDEKISELEFYKEIPGVKSNQIRKNAILGLEVLLTFSREDLEHVDIEKWKKDNVKWLKETFNVDEKKYGNTVLSAQYHADEMGNVHIHAFVVPIDNNGKLNASYFIDGPAKMTALQNSYGKLMKENHNLVRGLEGSKASHKDIKRFYAALNQEIRKEVPKPKDNENIHDYYERVNELYKDLNLKFLSMELEYKRKYSEFETIGINEKIEMEKTKDEIKRLKEILDKFGDVEFALDKINTINRLNSGIKNYPDREFAEQTFKNVKEILAYEEAKEKIDKEFDKENDKRNNLKR